jgi:hypothetical protein
MTRVYCHGQERQQVERGRWPGASSSKQPITSMSSFTLTDGTKGCLHTPAAASPASRLLLTIDENGRGLDGTLLPPWKKGKSFEKWQQAAIFQYWEKISEFVKNSIFHRFVIFTCRALFKVCFIVSQLAIILSVDLCWLALSVALSNR